MCSQPTSGWALQDLKGWLLAGRSMSCTWPGARSIGVVGPSSIPFERWTSTRTRVRVASVVFSTVPVKALAAESYVRIRRAPARTSSNVSPSAYCVPDSSPPSLDSAPSLCSPDSDSRRCFRRTRTLGCFQLRLIRGGARLTRSCCCRSR